MAKFENITIEKGMYQTRGGLTAARRLTLLRLPLIRALFEETNPAPVKRAMEICGLCRGELRLPLSPVGDALSAKLAALLGMT